MNTQTAALRRAVQASRRLIFPRTLLITIIFFVLMYLFYFFMGIKDLNNYKPNAFYHHWKKKEPPIMACGVPVQNDPIIKVNHLKTYMVGSYIEHRLDVKMIRTIAIVLRSENTTYQCMLCCGGKSVSVSANYSIHADHFGFEYGTADITCQVPGICPTPTHVAITSRLAKEDGSLQGVPTFQPVRNQQKLKDFLYEFTVCISTMFDYANVLELVQAMEMFKILGVQKVAIYKTSCDPVTQKVLDYYVKQNFVEIVSWRVESYIKVSPEELHYFGKIAALNDCVYRYMYQTRYVALQDLDEFILPLHVKNWNELLPELEREYNHEVGFEFENNLFPLSIRDPSPKYSPSSWKKVTGINVLEYVYRLSNDPAEFNAFKVIVNPRLVFTTSVHGFVHSIKGSVRVENKTARLYHMRNVASKSMPMHSHIRDTRLRDYAGKLIPAVSEVLQEVLNIY